MVRQNHTWLLAGLVLGIWSSNSPAWAKEYLLKSTPETVIWGRLYGKTAKPALRIRSGDTVTIETVSHEGILEDQSQDGTAAGAIEFLTQKGVPEKEILQDQLTVRANVPHDGKGPHVVTGPIYVEGAMPGDVLQIETLKIEHRASYGFVSSRKGKGALPGEYPVGDKVADSKYIKIVTDPQAVQAILRTRKGQTASQLQYANFKREGITGLGILKPDTPGSPSYEIPLKPFMGLIGVAPENDAETVNSVPPGRYGGNIDLNLITAGTTLYLPVQVPGALMYTGDPHCAQGDGEVALTAIECSLKPTFRITLRKDLAAKKTFTAPFLETPIAFVPIGLNQDLDEAMKDAVRKSLTFITEVTPLNGQEALQLSSAAVDFEVTQVVDIVKGIHGVIMKDLIKVNRIK
ncbi:MULTISPECIES: acetamidase/formamidase family protein [Trichocoleus]|uniref:Acetamidase/formamidase family protein n=1 Tax=Trichocoleus desertorum GB2-A4 TaxID=2933944 RepID=A0ABV0J3B0_9CYAN|nr:acetamidase/formamidase family protein [Trichocoleus sp. FACHB-46]MBD1860158.1 acetamidase/formamidase family protein [Trichocoleus sp. FACHB-46]